MAFDDDEDTFTSKVLPYLGRLKRATDVLLQSLSKAVPASDEVGTLEVNDGEVKATCLGHELKCTVRPVVNGRAIPAAVEMAFFVVHREEPVLIRKYYLLLGDASLHSTLAGQNDHVSRLDNLLLRVHLVQDIAEGLLRSPVFAPTPDASPVKA